jgi:hypothetical protein
VAGTVRSIEKSSDLPACSVVPQATVLPRETSVPSLYLAYTSVVMTNQTLHRGRWNFVWGLVMNVPAGFRGSSFTSVCGMC